MSVRRTVQTAMAHADGAELLVLSGREAPELKELTNLPDGMHLLDTGRPGQELKGASLQQKVHAYMCAARQTICYRTVQKLFRQLGTALHRLVEGGLGQSKGSAEVRDRQRCFHQTRASGRCSIGRKPVGLIMFKQYCHSCDLMLQDIWPHLSNLKWIHSASAGVEKLLFPELVNSKVVVTNAKASAIICTALVCL